MDQYEYLFPFELIEKDATVIIYGGGQMGFHYLKQCIITGYCNVIAIIDKKWESYQSKYSDFKIPIYSVERVADLKYDNIVIAMKNKNHIDEALNELSQIQIPKEKIVCGRKRQSILGDKKETTERREHFKDYSLYSGERQTGKKLSEIRADHIKRYELVKKALECKFKDESNIFGLDCFCGVGYGSFLLSSHLSNVTVLGIDGSLEAVEFANKHYSNFRTFFSHKLYPFYLPKDCFDFIVSFESIEHIENG